MLTASDQFGKTLDNIVQGLELARLHRRRLPGGGGPDLDDAPAAPVSKGEQGRLGFPTPAPAPTTADDSDFRCACCRCQTCLTKQRPYPWPGSCPAVETPETTAAAQTASCYGGHGNGGGALAAEAIAATAISDPSTDPSPAQPPKLIPTPCGPACKPPPPCTPARVCGTPAPVACLGKKCPWSKEHLSLKVSASTSSAPTSVLRSHPKLYG
ncbi:MAG: hypothetical protein WKG07_44870 [Hymenobacter sp.]